MIESGRGPVPSFAEAVVGQPIDGNWWRRSDARAIFRATRAVRDSSDVLVCRLIGGRITYVHRRLWPAMVRLADEIGRSRLRAIREEHTETGAHRLVTVPFATWVPQDVTRAAAKLTKAQAREACSEWFTGARSGRAAGSVGRLRS
jgi:hypothetical protein